MLEIVIFPNLLFISSTNMICPNGNYFNEPFRANILKHYLFNYVVIRKTSKPNLFLKKDRNRNSNN